MNKEEFIKRFKQLGEHSMPGHLGIEITEVGEDFITATMPVNTQTIQPMGILHGGASVAFAETLGSFGSLMFLDITKEAPVGLEINANHLRSVPKGKFVKGTATIIHKGRKTHVWDIRITNEENKLVCISRLTIAVVPRR